VTDHAVTRRVNLFTVWYHMPRILASGPPLRERLGTVADLTARAYRTELFLARMKMVLASLV
jgi:hypothetical protein